MDCNGLHNQQVSIQSVCHVVAQDSHRGHAADKSEQHDVYMSTWATISEECFQQLVVCQIIKADLKAKVSPIRYQLVYIFFWQMSLMTVRGEKRATRGGRESSWRICIVTTGCHQPAGHSNGSKYHMTTEITFPAKIQNKLKLAWNTPIAEKWKDRSKKNMKLYEKSS